MTPITITQTNEKVINEALYDLSRAYNQVKNFADQLQTEFIDSGEPDATTLTASTMVIIWSGLDSAAPPSQKEYTKWAVDIEATVADGSAWSITKIRRTCTNTEDTSL